MGDARIAQMLVDAKANLEATTRLGAMTPLYLAAKNGHDEVMEILLKAGANANATSATGATALMMASASGSARAVESLLAKGVDVNGKDKAHGQTALMFAAAANRAEVVHILMKHHANPEVTSRTSDPGCGSVFARDSCAAEAEDGKQPRDVPYTGKLNELIEPKPAEAAVAEAPKTDARKKGKPAENPDAANESAPKPSPEIAELRNELKKLEGMIDALEKKGSNDGSAARRRRGSTVVGGMTALLFAARDGQMEAAKALLEEGADVNAAGQGEKLSPLVMAITNGHFDLAKYLLDKNADPNLANLQGLTALYAVVDMQWAPYAWRPQPVTSLERTSYLELMRALLDHGANPNARLTQRVWFRALPGDRTWVDQSGATPFWRAAQATDLDAMKLLVSAGANPKLPTYEGVTPLMIAAGLGWAPNFTRNAADAWIPAVKYCLEAGLDINAKANNGYTALHGTAFIGNDELIKFMISKGADVTVVAKDKNTVVDMANGPFPHALVHAETIALLEGLGAKNSNNCRADTCLIAPDAIKPRRGPGAAPAKPEPPKPE
jgi:ankyrin repeat protein